MEIKGSIVALVTPFKNGVVDDAKIQELVAMHIEAGTDALVPVGTTGESPTLSIEEHKHVIDVVAKAAAGKIKVIAGTGSNSTAETIEMTKYAKEVGVDACLLVCPYYNKPSQEGIYQHYKAVTEAVDIPLVLYTIPGRSVVNITPQTVARLAEFKNIVAVKEASGDIGQMMEIVKLCGDKITLLSGDDALTLPMFSIGCKGIISVAANIIPKDMAAFVAALENGDFKAAKDWHYKMLDLFNVMFIETNPVGIKTAMALNGMIEEEMRLPLCVMADGNKEKLAAVLKTYGVL